jgi:D-glycero-D-manno-heptose 1,7-bisphosphate phosphatase
MRCIFLDRDGVVNRNRDDYVRTVAEFEFLPGALRGLARLAASPFAIVVVTNQSAIGRGAATATAVAKIHAHLKHEVVLARGRIDGIYVCPHHPDLGCDCRKPKSGLLHTAAAELGLDLDGSYLIGDALSDVQAALSAGCRPILVLTGRGRATRTELATRGMRAGVVVTADLEAAVESILSSA